MLDTAEEAYKIIQCRTKLKFPDPFPVASIYGLYHCLLAEHSGNIIQLLYLITYTSERLQRADLQANSPIIGEKRSQPSTLKGKKKNI